VNRKPMELFQGGSDVVEWSEVHYEASSGVLNSLQRSDRRTVELSNRLIIGPSDLRPIILKSYIK